MGNEPIRFVTPKILDAILQRLVNPMDRAMLLLASEGLRVEEIVRLKIGDIDVENSLIRVQKNINEESKVVYSKVNINTINECCASYKQQCYLSISKKAKAETKNWSLHTVVILFARCIRIIPGTI